MALWRFMALGTHIYMCVCVREVSGSFKVHLLCSADVIAVISPLKSSNEQLQRDNISLVICVDMDSKFPCGLANARET